MFCVSDKLDYNPYMGSFFPPYGSLNPSEPVYIRLSVLDDLDNVNEQVRAFYKLTEELTRIYSRKNYDYGDSFTESMNEDGMLVAKIRLGDKFRRLSTLINNDDIQVKDETIKDTLMDMAGYALMTVMWMEDKNGGED